MKERRTIDLGPLPALIGYVLRRAQLAVFQDFFGGVRAVRHPPAQFSVLTIIERDPGLTQTQVAEALGIKRTNFVGMLDELDKRGTRRAAAGARQAVVCAVSHHRRRRADAQVQARDQDAESHMIARVGEDGRDSLVALLQEIAEGARTSSRTGKLREHFGRDRLRLDLGEACRTALQPYPCFKASAGDQNARQARSVGRGTWCRPDWQRGRQ